LKLCPVRHRLAISSADKHNCTPAHFFGKTHWCAPHCLSSSELLNDKSVIHSRPWYVESQ